MCHGAAAPDWHAAYNKNNNNNLKLEQIYSRQTVCQTYGVNINLHIITLDELKIKIKTEIKQNENEKYEFQLPVI